MSTSRPSLGKRAACSLKRMFGKLTIRHSPHEKPSESANNTAHRLARMRRSITNIFPKKTETPIPPPVQRQSRIFVFGILGIGGPLDSRNSGWMVSDYGALASLLSNTLRGYSVEQSQWHSVRPISKLFPNGSVIFGDAGCDRLVLPLPTPFEEDINASISAVDFKTHCMLSLAKMSNQVEPGDKLIIVLTGHGSFGSDGFQLHITTQSDEATYEATLTKKDLETTLKGCRGDLLLISNSCQSGHLQSTRWSLFCATDTDQESDSLSQSHSGYIRGSSFVACLFGEVARQHGLQFPSARAEPRPLNTPPGEPVPLPLSPPLHSLSPSMTSISISQPPAITFNEFIRHMVDAQRFLVENPINTFHFYPQSTVLWSDLLPLELSGETIRRISLKPEFPGFAVSYNEMVHPHETMQGGPESASVSPTCIFNPMLVHLATKILEIAHPPHTPEAFDAMLCRELLQHLANPESHESPFEKYKTGSGTLLYVLQSRHVQAVAVQQIAKELGWYDGVIFPFIARMIPGNWEVYNMVNQGFRVNEIPLYLAEHHFHAMRTIMDRSCAQWLAEKWIAAGRPVISCLEWDILVQKVGARTQKEAIC